VAEGDFGSGFPFNLLPAVEFNLSVSWSISASVRRKKYTKLYIYMIFVHNKANGDGINDTRDSRRVTRPNFMGLPFLARRDPGVVS
jgi:hypothetical protein